jgi:hypothetical protein
MKKRYFDNKDEERRYLIKTSNECLSAYFVEQGKTQAEADAQVVEFMASVAKFLYAYNLGTITPLFDAINASVLSFMTVEAKALAISTLS